MIDLCNYVIFQSMYALMAKCEELSRSVQPVYEIKDQMYKLYTDEKLVKELKQRALERAATFSWDRCVDETINSYNTLLSS